MDTVSIAFKIMQIYVTLFMQRYLRVFKLMYVRDVNFIFYANLITFS